MIFLKMHKAALSVLAGMACAIGLSSCDSFIYDDQGDCSVHYRVPFTFTQNILNADAFKSQVTGSVTLYVFDTDGRLALTKTESGAALAQDDYKMDIELVPGVYNMVAWCTGTSPMSDPTAFTIGGSGRPGAMSDLSATLPLLQEGEIYYQDHDIVPLFYGRSENVVCQEKDFGYIDLPTIDLMKDTNVINVILENLNGVEMKEGDFTVQVVADNSEMTSLNALTGDKRVQYLAWDTTMLRTEPGEDEETRAEGDEEPVATGQMTQHTTGRLMMDSPASLRVIRNTDGKAIININLTQYLTMVKGNYQGYLTDQQYLDRMAEHTLTFFIAEGDWYMAGGVYINGWKIVPPQNEDL